MTLALKSASPHPVFPVLRLSFSHFLFPPTNSIGSAGPETLCTGWGEEKGERGTGERGRKMGRQAQRNTTKHQIEDITPSNRPPVFPVFLFSFLLSSSILPIPNVSVVSRRWLLVGGEDKGPMGTGNGKTSTTDHHGTPNGGRDALKSTPTPTQVSPFRSSRFPLSASIRPIPKVSVVSKHWVLVGRGDNGVGRTENGRTSTTDHHGPHGTPDGGHYALKAPPPPVLSLSLFPFFLFPLPTVQ